VYLLENIFAENSLQFFSFHMFMVVHVYTEVYNWCMAIAQGRGLTFAVDNIPQYFRQKDCH